MSRGWQLLLLLTLRPGLAAQDESPTVPLVPLEVSRVVTVPGSSFAEGLIHPVMCDSEGNLYVRPASPLVTSASRVLKVSPDGQANSIFSVEKISGFPPRRTEITDFAIGSNAEVYLLVRKCKDQRCDPTILVFAPDGSYRSAIKLDRAIDPARLAVFDNGSFLLTGFEEAAPRRKDTNPPRRRPFTAIFDASGRFVSDVTLPKDAAALTSAGVRDNDARENARREAVQLGPVAARKGSIYVVRHSTNPLVYEISPSGQVVRTIEIAAPTENSWPMDLRSADNGRLVVEFNEKLGEGGWDVANAILSLVDSRTGARIIDYRSSRNLGIFGCYTGNALSFIATDTNGRSVLRYATIR